MVTQDTAENVATDMSITSTEMEKIFNKIELDNLWMGHSFFEKWNVKYSIQDAKAALEYYLAFLKETQAQDQNFSTIISGLQPEVQCRYRETREAIIADVRHRVTQLTAPPNTWPKPKTHLIKRATYSLIIGTIIAVIILVGFVSLLAPTVSYTDNLYCDICGLPSTTDTPGYTIENNGTIIHEFCYLHSVSYEIRLIVTEFTMDEIPSTMSNISYGVIGIILGTFIPCWLLVFLLYNKAKRTPKAFVSLSLLWSLVAGLNFYLFLAQFHPEAFGYSMYLQTNFGTGLGLSNYFSYPFEVLFKISTILFATVELYFLPFMLLSKNYFRAPLVSVLVSAQVVMSWLNYYVASTSGVLLNAKTAIESPLVGIMLYSAIIITIVAALTFVIFYRSRQKSGLR